MSYEVEIKRTGRAGYATYFEDGGSLRFRWDTNTEGIEIYVPTASEWAPFCEENGAEWAKGRRQEILERVAREYCRQRAKKAEWRIADRWVFIAYANYLTSRLLDWILGNERA